jgi:hypothetical protein
MLEDRSARDRATRPHDDPGVLCQPTHRWHNRRLRHRHAVVQGRDVRPRQLADRGGAQAVGDVSSGQRSGPHAPLTGGETLGGVSGQSRLHTDHPGSEWPVLERGCDARYEPAAAHRNDDDVDVVDPCVAPQLALRSRGARR